MSISDMYTLSSAGATTTLPGANTHYFRLRPFYAKSIPLGICRPPSCSIKVLFGLSVPGSLVPLACSSPLILWSRVSPVTISPCRAVGVINYWRPPRDRTKRPQPLLSTVTSLYGKGRFCLGARLHPGTLWVAGHRFLLIMWWNAPGGVPIGLEACSPWSAWGATMIYRSTMVAAVCGEATGRAQANGFNE